MRERSLLAAAGLAVLLGGLCVGLLTGQRAAWPAAHAPAQAQATVQPPAAIADPSVPPAAKGSFVPAELVIDKLGIHAPVEVKGIDAHNVMEAPDRGTDAAWYGFTARPGSGSNAVFAGHRDFGRVGQPAIFWHLDELRTGDVVEVWSAQRTAIRYRVTQTWDYSLGDMPMAKVLATDRVDEVTLITCSGTYASGLGYDRRLVVRAVRTT
jgi:sortase A